MKLHVNFNSPDDVTVLGQVVVQLLEAGRGLDISKGHFLGCFVDTCLVGTKVTGKMDHGITNRGHISVLNLSYDSVKSRIQNKSGNFAKMSGSKKADYCVQMKEKLSKIGGCIIYINNATRLLTIPISRIHDPDSVKPPGPSDGNDHRGSLQQWQHDQYTRTATYRGSH